MSNFFRDCWVLLRTTTPLDNWVIGVSVVVTIVVTGLALAGVIQ